MLYSRNLFFIIISMLFIGAIVWWQNPQTAVSAMANSNYSQNSYSTVKNYFKYLDLRQFDMAQGLIADNITSEHMDIESELSNNPFLSIQKVQIDQISEENSFNVRVFYGSVVEGKKVINYRINVDFTERGWVITSLSVI